MVYTQVTFCVLDEADRMLDMGFEKEIKYAYLLLLPPFPSPFPSFFFISFSPFLPPFLPSFSTHFPLSFSFFSLKALYSRTPALILSHPGSNTLVPRY